MTTPNAILRSMTSEDPVETTSILRVIMVLAALWIGFSALAFEPVKDPRFERGYYVPTDLTDAVQQIDRWLSDEERATIAELELRDMSLYHHGLGTWIRNYWLRGEKSRLREYFRSLGVETYDEMSGIILEAYWLHSHGRTFTVEGLILESKRQTEAAAFPTETHCPDSPSNKLTRIFTRHRVNPRTDSESWTHYYECPVTGKIWVYENKQWSPATEEQAKDVADFLAERAAEEASPLDTK